MITCIVHVCNYTCNVEYMRYDGITHLLGCTWKPYTWVSHVAGGLLVNVSVLCKWILDPGYNCTLATPAIL